MEFRMWIFCNFASAHAMKCACHRTKRREEDMKVDASIILRHVVVNDRIRQGCCRVSK